MEKELAEKDLFLVKKVFDRYKVPFFLAYGTCLGIYRDKDFLPGDDDIDLGVVEKINLKTRKAIGWMLYDLGFKPQEILFNVFGRMEPSEPAYNGDENTGIIVCKNNVKITIFFFQEEDCKTHGKEMVCVPKLGAVKLIASPSKFYKEFDKVKFKEEQFFIPSPIKDYLEFTYIDWEDPLRRDHGETFNKMHPDYMEMMKDVFKKNEAIIY